VVTVSDAKKNAQELKDRLGATDAGKRAGVSRAQITFVANGSRQASPELASRLAKAVADLSAKKAPRKPRAANTSVAGLEATIDDIDDTLADDIPVSAKASLYRARIAALQQLADLRGERELNMTKLVGSKLWQDIRSRLRDALAPFPEAAAAVAEAFEGIE
jgi:hypothetical protein